MATNFIARAAGGRKRKKQICQLKFVSVFSAYIYFTYPIGAAPASEARSASRAGSRAAARTWIQGQGQLGQGQGDSRVELGLGVGLGTGVGPGAGLG